MEEEEFMLMFPPDGLVYDYRLDDAGTSLTERVNEGWVVSQRLNCSPVPSWLWDGTELSSCLVTESYRRIPGSW